MRFSKMPLSRQTMMIMLLSIGVLAATLIGVVLRVSSQSMESLAREAIETAALSRARALTDYAATLQDQAAAFARSGPVMDAVVELATGWQLATRNETVDLLRATYVENNPFPEGERQKLEEAPGLTEYYAAAHAVAQPLMRDFVGLGRFMDVFVVGADGTVIYSYRKTDAFATRLPDAAASSLASAVARGADGFTGRMEEPDTPLGYAASYGFRMTDRNGGFLATLVLRVDDRRIAEILADRTGIGDAGRNLLVFQGGRALSFEAGTTRPLAVAAPFLDSVRPGRAAGGDLTTDDGVLNVGAAVQLSGGARPATIVTVKPRSAVMAPVDHLVRILCVAAAAVAAVVLALGFLLMRRIMAPLNRTIREVRSLADGDYDIEISGRARGDEIGRLAGALQVFKENGLMMRRLEREAAEAREQTERQRKAELLDLAAGFEASIKGVVDRVAQASGRMTEVAGELRETAARTRQQSSAVAAASSQTAANVQMVATTAGELASSINEIGRQMELSNAVAREAGVAVERTGQSVEDLVAANRQIEDVVKLIADIATHTNLLALNATIEAARAGEAGKGFAIVASEVKALATQTAKATDDIAAQITTMQRVSAEVVEAVRRIGGVIGQMNEIAATAASAVEEQLAATKEIARNVTQAAIGTEQVSGGTNSVQVAAETTEQAAGQTLTSAHEIAEQSARLEEEVSGFLLRVRGAED